jgi:hypothetical protein
VVVLDLGIFLESKLQINILSSNLCGNSINALIPLGVEVLAYVGKKLIKDC